MPISERFVQLRSLTDAKPRAVEFTRTAEARTDARSAGRNCLQVMPSKEEENSHSEIKEENPANAGLRSFFSFL